jgi:hypothetical protein
VQRWNLPEGWVISKRPGAHGRPLRAKVREAARALLGHNVWRGRALVVAAGCRVSTQIPPRRPAALRAHPGQHTRQLVVQVDGPGSAAVLSGRLAGAGALFDAQLAIGIVGRVRVAGGVERGGLVGGQSGVFPFRRADQPSDPREKPGLGAGL